MKMYRLSRYGTCSACVALPLFLAVSAGPAVAQDATAREEIVVNGLAQGTAENGYRVDTVTLGPLGRASLQDTPFSINVVPSELIQNLQASSTADALKYDPTVHATLGSNISSNYFMIRGFLISPFGTSSSAATDSMRESVLWNPVEDKERIEVMNGPSGFFYGFASPGGLVNYVLKRPTAQPLADITVGDYGGGQAYIHGDFGGPLDDAGRFGYRFNLAGVDSGDVGVANETHERLLVSGAFDWHVAPDTLWSFDISHFQRAIWGQQIIFMEGAVTAIPRAPDLSKNYGAPYNFTRDSYTKYGTELTSKLSDSVSVRAAFRYTEAENSDFAMRGNWLNNAGDYNFQAQAKGTNTIDTTQGYGFLDAAFDTGPLKHTVTVGLSMDYAEAQLAYPNGNSTYIFPTGFVSSVGKPVYPANPYYQFPLDGPMRATEQTTLQTVIVSDQIALGKEWLLLLGGNFAHIDDKNWNVSTGLFASDYNRDQASPALALMYKPMPSLSLYTSYIEALQAGPTAPAGTANANEVLAPFVSEQVEVGVKADLGGVNLNAALFRIQKANAFTDPVTNIYSLDGEEVHTGGEVTLGGKVTNDLTLIGGFTILNAEVTKTSTAGLSGKSPLGVPSVMGSLYAEYGVPRVPGLTLSAGVSYTAREWVNSPNTLSIPAVVLADIGVRYKTELFGAVTTFRLQVNNLNGEDYWTSKGDTLIYPGNPRTVAVSVEVGL
jgi:iron complex outermembrane receptor protein